MTTLEIDEHEYELEQATIQTAVDSMEDDNASDDERMRQVQINLDANEIDQTLIDFLEQPHGELRLAVITTESVTLFMEVTRSVWNIQEGKDHRAPPNENDEQPINAAATMTLTGPYTDSTVEAR